MTAVKIIIGSSPLLLIEAIRLRRLGNRVLIVDSSKNLGGVWSSEQSTIKFQRGRGEYSIEFEHETACHLLEWYVKGYQTLEELTGQVFDRLDPQPVKVRVNGIVTSYTSPTLIGLKFFKNILDLVVWIMKMSVSLASKDNRRRVSNVSKLNSLLLRVHDDVKYRLFGLSDFTGLREPRDGYLAFIQKLVSDLKDQKIEVIQGLVFAMHDEDDDSIIVTLEDKTSFKATEVILGDSSSVRFINGRELPSPVEKSRVHYLISVPKNHVIIFNRYVHYVGSVIRRISFVQNISIDQMEEKEENHDIELSVFLVESLKSFDSLDALRLELKNLFKFYQIIDELTGLRIIKEFEKKYFYFTGETIYPSQRIRRIKTYGDLSLNALHYCDSLKVINADQHSL